MTPTHALIQRTAPSEAVLVYNVRLDLVNGGWIVAHTEHGSISVPLHNVLGVHRIRS